MFAFLAKTARSAMLAATLVLSPAAAEAPPVYMHEINVASTAYLEAFLIQSRPVIGAVTTAERRNLTGLLTNAAKVDDLRVDEFAYMLATIAVETAWTFSPITEYGSRAYFNKYDPAHAPRKAAALGNTDVGDGYRFRGRGYVQITGRRNYAVMGERIGVDLASQPELALEEEIAFKIMVVGMRKGVFTGKKLGHYIGQGTDDYVNARRIINGKDRATEIAGYAEIFLEALQQ